MLIPYFAINPEARRPQLTMKRQKIPHLFAHLAVLILIFPMVLTYLHQMLNQVFI